MTDIAGLIERARREAARAAPDDGSECCHAPHWTCCDPDLLIQLADTLSRLTAPPPDEIAGLIERLGKIDEAPFSVNDCYAVREAAAALRALAQENERLKGIESDYLRRHKDACDRWERIRELEAAAKAPPPDEIAHLLNEAHDSAMAHNKLAC